MGLGRSRIALVIQIVVSAFRFKLLSPVTQPGLDFDMSSLLAAKIYSNYEMSMNLQNWRDI